MWSKTLGIKMQIRFRDETKRYCMVQHCLLTQAWSVSVSCHKGREVGAEPQSMACLAWK